MKKSLWVILVLLLIIVNAKASAKKTAYIKFEHLASIDSKYIRPIFISKRELNKQDFFVKSDYNGFEKLFPNHNDFLNSQFDFVVTNSSSFRILKKYLAKKLKSFSYPISAIMISGYMVTTPDGNKIYIPDKDSQQFFIDLIFYLNKHNSDNKITNALNSLL